VYSGVDLGPYQKGHGVDARPSEDAHASGRHRRLRAQSRGLDALTKLGVRSRTELASRTN
jgi:hypothetical protein